MSFLDNIKNQEKSKINPFSSSSKETKINPFSSSSKETKTNSLNSSSKETKVNPFNPFAKKKEEIKQEEVKQEEVKQKEVKQEEVKQKEVKQEEVKQEEVKQEEVKQEEVKQEEVKQEEVKQEEVKQEEVKQEEVKQEKSKRKTKQEKSKQEEVKQEESKRKTKKNTKRNTKKNTKNSTNNEEVTTINLPTTTVNYSSAIANIKSPFVDSDWEKFREKVEKKLNEIVIDNDMNPSTLKVIISQLSVLRQEIWSVYQDTKTMYETLSNDKPEGLIERIKKIAFNRNHANDMERRKAGVEACMNYIAPNTTNLLNLYEILDETRARYNFLKATLDSIQYKTSVLITMNGALKLEKEHIYKSNEI